MTGEFDRDAVSRIVARAASSAPSSSDRRAAGPDPGVGDAIADEQALRDAVDGDRLDAESIVEAAAEVGISPTATRRSIAIERIGPPPRSLAGDRVVGPREVVAQRTVNVERREAVERLDEWLTAGHHLRREVRETPDGDIHVRWVRRNDIATGIWRRVRSVRGEARLGGQRSVTVRAAPVDAETTLVRVGADRSDERTTSIAGGAALVGTGAIGIGLAASGVVVAAPFALVAAPFVVGGVVYARRGRVKAQRLDHELVRVLDSVAAGEPPPGVLAKQRRLRRSISRNG